MTDNAPESPVDTPDAPQENADEVLGEAGKKALVAEREARKQAEKLAGEYKAKLDEIEQSNLTELEKAQNRAESAEAALAAQHAETLRLTIAAKHGITGDNLELLVGANEAELEARAEKLAALLAKTPKGPVIPDQGKTPTDKSMTTADLFAQAVEGAL